MAKLIGDKPNQVPTNADLGDLAYQDGDNAVIGPITVAGGNASVSGTTSLNRLAVNGNNYPSVGPLSNRNKIINGAMTIDQRNAGAAVTVNGSYVVDRFSVINTSDGAFSAQQVSEAPSGFTKSVKVTTTTADATLTTTQNLNVVQIVEGFNTVDLGWGTAAAQAATLSFWVRSSLTGTFGGSFRNSAANRSYAFTYSISAANTWEYKTVTVAGDTIGTWLTDNGGGIIVTFGLGAGPDRSGTADAWAAASYVSATGAVSVIGTLNATWQITGVQLEAGDTATPFEHRSFGQELALCQRYTFVLNSNDSNLANRIAFGMSSSTTKAYCQIRHPVSMRAKPSLTTVIAAGQTINLSDTAGSTTTTSLVVQGITTDVNQTQIDATVASGLTAFRSYYLEFDGAGSTLTLSAEL